MQMRPVKPQKCVAEALKHVKAACKCLQAAF